MQAVLLAAGRSSRLAPFNNGIHKSMIRLLGKPLLEHTLIGLQAAGVKDIILVVDKSNEIEAYFGKGENIGVSIEYVVQKAPLGMGDALLCAKHLINGDFLLLHGYHVDAGDFIDLLIRKKTQNIHGVLLAEEREDTWKYGVLQVDRQRITDVIEKPEKGKEVSKLCVVGIYLLQKDFLPVLEAVPTSHYHFEEALSSFAKQAHLASVIATTPTVVLKYSWDLLMVKDYLVSRIKKSIGKDVKIEKSAEITGNVHVGNGARIMEGAKIKGPAYIGENAFVGTNAILRNGVVVENGSVVGANMEIKNSILMVGATTHSGFIGDSVIGQECKIAAQFVTANVRLDRQNIKTVVRDEIVDTGKKSLGVMMGNNVKVGVHGSTMPGVIVGNNTVIGPSTVVKANVKSNVKYYSKFEGIVEEIDSSLRSE